MIIALEFQLFGYNLVLGLLNNIDYFGYMSFIGVCIFFGILIKLRVTFNIINIQNGFDDANVRDVNNPIMLWGFKLMVFVTIFYILSFFVMGEFFYDYYLYAFYTFGFPQIWFSAKYGSRNCFKWQYQVIFWSQTIVVPVFLKGYDGNFLRLTPCPLNMIVLPSAMVFQI